MMIFKMGNLLVVSLAVFYVAELTGLVEEGKYFPTLPRFEASAQDPMAWLGAAQWGLSKIGTLAVNEAYAQGLDTSNLTSGLLARR